MCSIYPNSLSARAYEIHSKWFSLTRHEFDVIYYCGTGLLKLCVFLLFLFPCIAIRLVLGKRNA